MTEKRKDRCRFCENKLDYPRHSYRVSPKEGRHKGKTFYFTVCDECNRKLDDETLQYLIDHRF